MRMSFCFQEYDSDWYWRLASATQINRTKNRTARSWRILNNKLKKACKRCLLCQRCNFSQLNRSENSLLRIVLQFAHKASLSVTQITLLLTKCHVDSNMLMLRDWWWWCQPLLVTSSLILSQPIMVFSSSGCALYIYFKFPLFLSFNSWQSPICYPFIELKLFSSRRWYILCKNSIMSKFEYF